MTTSPPGPTKLKLWITSPKDGNPLRLFLAWRKRCRIQGTFAHAGLDTTLHRDMSLLDNFMLSMGEPPIDMPENEKKSYVHKNLEKTGLFELTKWFNIQTARPTNMTVKERSMASVCCALLTDADETLIDFTSMQFDELALVQLYSTLMKFNRTVTIATTNENQWSKFQFNTFNPNQGFVVIKKSA